MPARAKQLAEGYRRGILAMAPAVVITSVPSMLVNTPWPLEPIAERVMMLTPVDTAQWLILNLGLAARPLALLGGFAVSLLVGGLSGLVAAVPIRHAPPIAAPAAAVLVLLAILFLVFPPLAYLPTLALALVFIASWLLIGRRAGGAAGDTALRRGRRAFLVDSAVIVGSAASLCALLVVEPWYKALTVFKRGGRLFAFTPRGPRQLGFQINGLTPEVTTAQNFYYLSKNLVDPDLSTDGWSLSIGGRVGRPRRYSFDELIALSPRSLYVTQECVSNPVGGPLISCALFTGVPLRHLLAPAGPLPGATKVVMRAPDGHADSIPLDIALGPDVMVVYGMNGAYLERAHGYPARILIPGSYGFKSIKWVESIELVDHAFKGTWQELGWTESAIVHTTTRIDVATSTHAGAMLAGVAFAGTRGILKVQVRANGGAWVDATLHAPALSPLTWVQWRAYLPVHGRIRFEARAIDRRGAAQESRQSDIYPAGATGYHGVTVDV